MDDQILFLVIGGFFYLLPWVVAYRRGHRSTVSIFILNVALGWTFIGWLGALIWANTSNTAEPGEGDTKPCPFCAEPVKQKAIVCKHCGRDLPSHRAA